MVETLGNLKKLMSEFCISFFRHQRDQVSLIKTLSQASFNQIPSGTNLKALENTYSNMNNGANGQRSLSVPTEAYHYHTNNVEKNTSKKEKEKEKQKKVEGDPGMLEFVKVDVENNMVRFFVSIEI